MAITTKDLSMKDERILSFKQSQHFTKSDLNAVSGADYDNLKGVKTYEHWFDDYGYPHFKTDTF